MAEQEEDTFVGDTYEHTKNICAFIRYNLSVMQPDLAKELNMRPDPSVAPARQKIFEILDDIEHELGAQLKTPIVHYGADPDFNAMK